MSVKRVQKELVDSRIYTRKEDKCGNVEFHLSDYIKVQPGCDDFSVLRAEIQGPPDTQYQGQKFEVSMKFPDDYPFEAPDVKFVSKISHPNIDEETGEICQYFLEDWSPGLKIHAVLLSIYCLLGSPVPKPYISYKDWD